MISIGRLYSVVVQHEYDQHVQQRPQRRTGADLDALAGIIGGCDVPTVLAGDFNVSREEELDLLAGSALQKAVSLPTFPSWKPRKALDHLFFSRHFEIARVYAFDAHRFSDHLPLVAEVRLSG